MKAKAILKDMIINYLRSRSDVSDHTLKSISYVINNFVNYLNDDIEVITEQIYLDWINSRRLINNTKSNYQKILRQFIYYVNNHGYSFTIPDVIKTRDEYIPHYFSEEEFLEIINSVDNYHFSNFRAKCEDYCLPMLARILISTGARINEICCLRISDYDRKAGVIHTKISKGKKERLIPLHQDLVHILNKYIDKLKEIDSNIIYMFPLKNHNKHMTVAQVDNVFRVIFKRIGYKRTNKYYQRDICPHCFRHSFAINSFKQSLEKGYDIVDVVPFLSIYLGHARLSETEKYLKFSTDLFPENIQQFEDYMNDVFDEELYL